MRWRYQNGYEKLLEQMETIEIDLLKEDKESSLKKLSDEVVLLSGLLKNASVYGLTDGDIQDLKKCRNTVNKLLFAAKTYKIRKL